MVEVESLGDDLFMLRERYDGSSFILVYPNDRPISLTPEIPSTEDRHHIATCNKMQCLYLSTVNYQTQKLYWENHQEHICIFSMNSEGPKSRYAKTSKRVICRQRTIELVFFRYRPMHS